jgi:hypothetical protein
MKHIAVSCLGLMEYSKVKNSNHVIREYLTRTNIYQFLAMDILIRW